MAAGPVPARSRAPAVEAGSHVHESPMSGDDVHLVALGVADRAADLPDNGMFENARRAVDEGPAAGHTRRLATMLRKAGYYTAYKGKWHLEQGDQHARDRHVHDGGNGAIRLRRQFLAGRPDRPAYWAATASTTSPPAARSLVAHGRAAAVGRGKGPWCMTVSFVNPHDIMYFSTPMRPAKRCRTAASLRMHAARAPEHALYKAGWDVPVPVTLRQPFDAPGRPCRAHPRVRPTSGITSWATCRSRMSAGSASTTTTSTASATLTARWKALFAELDALGPADNTIIVFSADHGEMAGAHGLRGKWTLRLSRDQSPAAQLCSSRREGRPGVPGPVEPHRHRADPPVDGRRKARPGGRDCRAGARAGTCPRYLANPGSQPLDARRGLRALFTYSGLASNDAAVFDFAAKAVMAGKDPKEEAKRQGFARPAQARPCPFGLRWALPLHLRRATHRSTGLLARKTLDELFKLELTSSCSTCLEIRPARWPDTLALDPQPMDRARVR